MLSHESKSRKTAERNKTKGMEFNFSCDKLFQAREICELNANHSPQPARWDSCCLADSHQEFKSSMNRTQIPRRTAINFNLVNSIDCLDFWCRLMIWQHGQPCRFISRNDSSTSLLPSRLRICVILMKPHRVSSCLLLQHHNRSTCESHKRSALKTRSSLQRFSHRDDFLPCNIILKWDSLTPINIYKYTKSLSSLEVLLSL